METPVNTEDKDKESRAGLIAGIISTLLWVVMLMVYLNYARLFPGGENDENIFYFVVIFGCFPYISLLLAMIALITGIRSLRRIRKSGQGDIRNTIFAVVPGALGMLPFVVAILAFFLILLPIMSK